MTESSTEPVREYQQLTAIKLPLVNKFYKQVKARGKASGGDIVWVARDVALCSISSYNTSAPIIAAARLTPTKLNEYWLLSGVYVAQSHRNQGIASQLITHLVAQQACCYTFALTQLSDFYQRLGFVEVAVGDLPCELAQKFDAYRQQGRNIIAMIKR